MALQLSTELPTGVTGDYYKITSIQLSEGRTQIALALFKDAAARTADKEPMVLQVLTWSDAENPCEVADMDIDNPYALCYAKLKTLPEFSGAVDV